MNRGSWAGFLTTIVVSKLMGCSLYIASKKLEELRNSRTKEEVTFEDIGNLIYEYRKEQKQLEEDYLLGKYFFNPIIRM